MREFLTKRHSLSTCYDFGNGSKSLDLEFQRKKKNEMIFLKSNDRTNVDIPYDIYEQYLKH